MKFTDRASGGAGSTLEQLIRDQVIVPVNICDHDKVKGTGLKGTGQGLDLPHPRA